MAQTITKTKKNTVAETKIGILGIGAIGTMLACLVSKSGYIVTCITKESDVAELSKGLTFESERYGTVHANPHVEGVLSTPVDVLLVTVKAPFLRESLKRIPSALVRGAAVSLLNGVGNVEIMRETIPNSLLGTIGSLEVEQIGRGHAKQIGAMTPHIEIARGGAAVPTEVFQMIRGVLQASGLTADIRETEAEVLWGKLARLNAVASVTALSGKTVGQVRDDRELMGKVEHILDEGIRAAGAEGVTLNREKLLAFVRALPYEMTTSLERDIRDGAPSELESITGGVLSRARSLGVPTPVLEETYTLLTEKARSGIKKT